MQLGLWILGSCATTATSSCLLGNVTCAEAGRIGQRLVKYLCFKTALVGMVVVPELTLLQWLPWVAMIGQLKALVSLTKGRLSALSVAPVAGLSKPARMLLLLLLVLAVNGTGITLLCQQLWGLSGALVLLLGLDMGATAVEAARAACSCLALLLDDTVATHLASNSKPTAAAATTSYAESAVAWWEGWQGSRRDTFFYNLELVGDVSVQLLTLLHHMTVWRLHGLDFKVLDALLLLDTRAVIVSVFKRLHCHTVQQAMLTKLNNSLPDAEVCYFGEAGEAECVICRDRMTRTAKKLPCGHAFHLQCLRAWLQQQSSSGACTCPICRTPLDLPQLGGTSSSSSSAVANSSAAPYESTGPLALHQAQQQWQQQQQQQRQQQQAPAARFNNSNSLLDLSYNTPFANASGSRFGSSSSGSSRVRQQHSWPGNKQQQRQRRQQQRRQQHLEGWNDERPDLSTASSSDSVDENFDALLQQALLVSLQTPPDVDVQAKSGSSSSSSDGGGGQFPTVQQRDIMGLVSLKQQQQQQQQQQAAQERQPGLICSSGSGSGSSTADAVSGGSSRSSSIHSGSADSTTASSSSSSGGSKAGAAAAADVQSADADLERLNSDKFQWSDPLTDTDADPSAMQPRLAAARQHVTYTCARVLSALMSTTCSTRISLAKAASAPAAAAAAAAAAAPPAAAAAVAAAGGGLGRAALKGDHQCGLSVDTAGGGGGYGVGGNGSRKVTSQNHSSSSSSSSSSGGFSKNREQAQPLVLVGSSKACRSHQYCTATADVQPAADQQQRRLTAAAAAAATAAAAAAPQRSEQSAHCKITDVWQQTAQEALAVDPAAAASADEHAAIRDGYMHPRDCAENGDSDDAGGGVQHGVSLSPTAAAAAVLLLRLRSPRADGRRREGGKWGRRHWAQQQQQQ